MEYEIETVQYTPNAPHVTVVARAKATEGPFRGTLQEVPLTQDALEAAVSEGAVWGDEEVRALTETWLAAYIPGATVSLRPQPEGA